MKVNNSIGQGLQNVESSKAKGVGQKGLSKSGEANKASAAELKSSSKVNLSERAQRMSQAKEIASDMSVDEAKVARLQKMIDEGSYKVNAEAIADRIVDEHIKMS